MAWLLLLFFATWRRYMAQFLIFGSILILSHYAEREKKPSEYCNFFLHFCRRRESNPGRQLSKRVRYPSHHCPSVSLLPLSIFLRLLSFSLFSLSHNFDPEQVDLKQLTCETLKLINLHSTPSFTYVRLSSGFFHFLASLESLSNSVS